MSSRLEQIGSLTRRLRRMEQSRRPPGLEREVAGTGHEALDRLLPDRGLRRGRLFEWINARGPGTGAATLALLAARELMQDAENRVVGTLVVIDRDGGFYAAAVEELGLPPQELLLVHPKSEAEWLWAVEQALRSPAVDVTLTWADRIEDRAFRRWQLAAEAGGGVGMLVRSAGALEGASWASVSLLVRSGGCDDTREREEGFTRRMGRRWGVSVLRNRAGGAEDDGSEWLLEWDDETGGLHLLSRLGCTASVGVQVTG